MAYEPLVEEIGSLHRKVSMLEAKGKSSNSDIYVENLDEVKKHLRDELARFGVSLKQIIQSSKLPSFNISETIKLSNIGDLERALKQIADVADALESKISKINFEPKLNVTATVPDVNLSYDVNIPEIKIPEIKAPNVTVSPVVDIDLDAVIHALEPLKLLSRSPKNPLSVRMSDGKEFLEELTRAVSRGNEQLATVVSTSSGVTSDELRTLGMSNPRNGGNKVVTVTAAGTPHNLSSGTTSEGSSLSTDTIYLSGDTDSGSIMVVGFSNSVRATTNNKNGIVIIPGNPPVPVKINDLKSLWVDAQSNGGKLCVGYTVS